MKKILLITLVLFLFLTQMIYCQGDLLVSPVRIVFEGNKQKEEISLVNIGNDTATYSVSFLQYNMTEDGSFVLIDKPGDGQFFADPYLRVFPRTITLAPREAQVVRLQLRRKPGMAPGEYRSHLYFRAEKETKPLGMDMKVKDPNLMSVQIIPIFGISIPVIIRTGDVKVASEITDMKIETLQDTITNLKLVINRTGNISIYGDITVEYIPSSGNPVEIGLARGVAVYTSVNRRNFSIKLNSKTGLFQKTGKLRVKYTSSKDLPYTLYAEKELVLN